MGVLVKNVTLSVTISLTLLRIFGLWVPQNFDGNKKLLYNCYTVFSFIFLVGTLTIIQVVALVLAWGNISLMTNIACLLFTNLAHVGKIVNVLVRKNRIQAIISDGDGVLSQFVDENERKIVKSCNKEMLIFQVLYLSVTFWTIIGWVSNPEEGQLPLQAWYPYDTTKSPAYELTYSHQVVAIQIAACMNIAKDTLVAALIAQCRCRLRLVGYALRHLGKELEKKQNYLLQPEQEVSLQSRLRWCVMQHQQALQAAGEVQACFSEPTFAQFTVSLIIICVTAFQLSMVTGNPLLLISMGTYLLNMIYQVFIYCYQGNQLSEESSEIAGSAYFCPWYTFSLRTRRTLLIMMVRTRRIAKVTAGGFTTLSLVSFMAIVKASYSLFTLLQQVTEN